MQKDNAKEFSDMGDTIAGRIDGEAYDSYSRERAGGYIQGKRGEPIGNRIYKKVIADLENCDDNGIKTQFEIFL